MRYRIEKKAENKYQLFLVMQDGREVWLATRSNKQQLAELLCCK